MNFLSKNGYLFSRNLFLFLSVFFCGTPVNAGKLSDFLTTFARRMVAQINPQSEVLSNPESSNYVVFKELSSLIKNYYATHENLPINALKRVEALYNSGRPSDDKKAFFQLLHGHKGDEKKLHDGLFEVFDVAATLVKRSITDKKPIELDFFSSLDENYYVSLPMKNWHFAFLDWNSPSYEQDPIWVQTGFIEAVSCVFFAILPNVPSKYVSGRSWRDVLYDAVGWTCIGVGTGIPAIGIAGFVVGELYEHRYYFHKKANDE